MTRYTITTAAGEAHRGLVQGSGGRLKGHHGLVTLRRASEGRPVNVYDPTVKPPYVTGQQEITHVAVYATDDTKDFATVPIIGAQIEEAIPETWDELAAELREHPGQWVTCLAWAVAGGDPDGCDIKVLNGRTHYEAAWVVYGPRGGERVRLARVVSDAGGIREIVRWLRPDDLVEVRRS